MALSKAKVREILSKAGVDAEHMQDALTEILDGNIASIEAVKEERDRYKEDADKLPALQKELDALKNNEGKSPYKVKYEAKVEEFDNLKKEYDAYKADVSAKELEAKKSSAYKSLLKGAGVSEKRIDSILKVTDLGKVELDDEGKVKDSEALTKSIKDEWSDFIVTESTQGANVSNPPANTGGNKMSKDEIMAIKDTSARQKAMLENKELFI